MSADPLAAYRAVWSVDFEFRAGDGERPEPHCMVAHEFRTGAVLRLWADELTARDATPFDVGPESLFVAYFASAELGCFLALGWPLPARVLDLYAEFSCLTSGLSVPSGRGLLGALVYYGIDAMGALEKTAMRDLAIRGGPFTEAERLALLDYCESDVVALSKLLPAMLPTIDLPRALLRGRYLAAVARMESIGTPIDLKALVRLRSQWAPIKMVAAVDADYGVYVPTDRRRIDPDTALGDALLRTASARVDPTGARLGRGVHRLGATRIWNCRRAVA